MGWVLTIKMGIELSGSILDLVIEMGLEWVRSLALEWEWEREFQLFCIAKATLKSLVNIYQPFLVSFQKTPSGNFFFCALIL